MIVLHLKFACPACGPQIPAYDDLRPPEYRAKLTGTSVCLNCGHIYSLDNGVARHLSKSERAAMPNHPNADEIKAYQKRVTDKLWG